MRLRLICGLLLAGLLGTSGAAAQEQACPAPSADAAYRIQNTWTGKVVAPEDESGDEGARMVSAVLDLSDPVQLWRVEATGDDPYVRLRNDQNGLYLRVDPDDTGDNGTGENAAVVQAPLDTASPEFHWRLDEAPGLCRPFHRTAQKHLRIRGNQVSPPGEPIVVRTLNPASGGQKWVFAAEGEFEVPEPPPGERLRTLAAENWDLRIGAAHRTRPWTLTDSAAYAAVFEREFSSLSPENAMKWPVLRPTPDGAYDWAEADRQVAYAQANGMEVHGHVLAWYMDADPEKRPGYWLTDPAQAPCSGMEGLLRDHITAVMTRYADDVDVWDVVNEAVDPQTGGYRTSDRWYECLGVGEGGVPNYIRVAFDEAAQVRQATGSDAALLYNEIGFLNRNPGMQERVYEMVVQLQSEGLPVDGLGFQYHEDLDLDFVAWTNYATRVAEDLGLDVYVTELDVKIPGEDAGTLDAQAQVYAETLERFLHLPRRADFTLWGFTDRHSWRNPDENGVFFNPLIFDEAYDPKPAYFALQRVLGGGTARETDRNAFERFEAEGHEAVQGGYTTRFARDAQGALVGWVDGVGATDYVKFARTDFGAGAQSVEVSYAAELGGGATYSLSLRTGREDGTEIAAVPLGSTGGTTPFQTVRVDLSSPASGVQDLYVVGAGEGEVRLDWLAFSAAPVSGEPPAGGTEFAVRGGRPNPATSTYRLVLDLPQPAEVTVEIFDVLGRRVQSSSSVAFEAGEGAGWTVDVSGLPSGSYLYRAVARAAGRTDAATGRFVVID